MERVRCLNRLVKDPEKMVSNGVGPTCTGVP